MHSILLHNFINIIHFIATCKDDTQGLSLEGLLITGTLIDWSG